VIGKELGGRYEIMERVGGGGMAVVYKGHDRLLNRKVAVKVLRQQYVHDDEFIQRFRREAQAAASLSHPNVVSIYDVGQEGDIHFIVMEFVEGTTLNERIKERAPLQVEEAVHYAGQICDALEHAHQNQIIHRDIKPHNILIGRNGRVKVTDFGIARAVTSSTITQTGSVVGSVHYFSPEHAKGVSTGAKSDLYSLGIVLYQMLTGRLPFLGESPISVALKHLQEDVEDPRKVNPLIPQSVENIILKAMRKNPDERYQSATEMLRDLETCLSPERRNEPKITFDDGIDEERTRVVPAIRSNHFENGNEEDEEDGDEQTERKKGWVKPLVWIIVLIVLIGAASALAMFLLKAFRVAEVPVPDVENQPVTVAEQMLTDAGLKYNEIPESSQTVPKDIVIRQDPKPMRLKVNSVVTLYISTGVELQKMAGYVNKSEKEARTDLVQGKGLKDEQVKVVEEFSDTVAPGIVMKQSPAENEEYDPANVTVTLTVSKGQETFKMPSLIGKSLSEARTILNSLNLKLAEDEVTYEPSYKYPEGKIVKQFPYEENDNVSRGKTIKVVLSSGLPKEAGQMTVTVPVKPAQEGKPSAVRIVLTDATHDAAEYKSMTIAKPDSVDVNVVVAPDKQAVIQVYVDNQVANVITKTYQDYLQNGKSQTGSQAGSQGTGAQGAGAANPPHGPAGPPGGNPGTAPAGNGQTGSGTGGTP
jgi:serine/threonine-protein kinase